MGTRACYRFFDEDRSTENSFTIYKHWDGYPEGAAKAIRAALEYAWEAPRYQAMDAAAAFVAANKDKGGGDVYITKAPESHGDIEYTYNIYPVSGKWNVSFWYSDEDDEESNFTGTLDEMVAKFCPAKTNK